MPLLACHMRDRKEIVMKSKVARLLVVAAAALMAPLQVSHASVADRTPSPAASAPADDGSCGDASAYTTTNTVIPSLSVVVCDDCRFSEMDRHALLLSYGDAARRAGYLVDPRDNRLFAITATGKLANGTSFLKGTIGNKQVTVGDPFPGETLASVAGKLVLIAVTGNR